MSKVSLKNDSLPTFEPINHTKVADSQKRKRNSDALKDNSTIENDNKRAKAENHVKNSVEPIKSVVWIGAILMQQEEINGKNEERVAAFSIFYGLNDKRNLTERVTIEKDQDLNHVYIMGANRALDKCATEDTILSIHTGDKDIQTVINQESQDAVYSEIKQKIANRKGTVTFIHSKDSASTHKNEENNIAHKMAVDEFAEDEAMLETESLKVEEVSVTAAVEVVQKDDIEMTTETEETIITTEKAPAAPSWAATLNLRNLLDILKAPFVRNKNN